MNRFTAVAAGALLLSTGCTHDGDWTFRKAMGWDDPKPRVVMPTSKEIAAMPPVPLEISARVENLGRTIIAKNTFTGIDPLFTAIGVAESVLFHRGTEQLFISQGLVEKCQSDAELAAVLCSELGQMVAEKRSAKAVGRDRDPIPDSMTGGTPLYGGGGAYDAARQAELAYHERRFPKDGSRLEAVDAITTARDLLKGAGYSPSELDRVEALLKQSERGEKLRKQMGGSAPAPEWQK
jgi:hypothetical protein